MIALIDSYMDGLRKKRDAELLTGPPPASLVAEVRAWWESQTEINRFPCYSMRFLVNTFGYAPGKLGVALAELGWTRRRSWAKNKPFCRVWVPPGKTKIGGSL